MFFIKHIIQLDLEHWRDYAWALVRFDRGDISKIRYEPTFTGPNFADRRRGIAKTILGPRHQDSRAG